MKNQLVIQALQQDPQCRLHQWLMHAYFTTNFIRNKLVCHAHTFPFSYQLTSLPDELLMISNDVVGNTGYASGCQTYTLLDADN